MAVDYIDTDLIFQKLRDFEKVMYKKPFSIKLNPADVRYLKSNIGFAPLGDMDTIEIGWCLVMEEPKFKDNASSVQEKKE